MTHRRALGLLLALLATIILAACGAGSQDSSSPPPLQATASSATGCHDGQGYQHSTLAYRLCYPNGWVARDYTAEPGSGGAVSVVAFGPPAAVPTHVPAQSGFAPPIEVRVVAGPKAQEEPSLAAGNQVTPTRIAGIAADRIQVTQAGPAEGAIILVFEHQANTYEIEKAPGSVYAAEFQKVLDGFSFASTS